MYFPIFRGRQYELLALRELLEKGLLHEKIVPVIEPVKVSATFIRTIDSFIENGRKVAIIRNPQTGEWEKDLKNSTRKEAVEKIQKQFSDSHIISAYYVNSDLSDCLKQAEDEGRAIDSLIFVWKTPGHIDEYLQLVGNRTPKYNIIPDKIVFRKKIRDNLVLCEDHFPKKKRNADYFGIEQDFFSSDHLYYDQENFTGFSDYSVSGQDFELTEFDNSAVVIHIVYFNDNHDLMIKHFVSDSNTDPTDSAERFAEAAAKLVEWNQKEGNFNTAGIRALEEAYRNGTTPGSGVILRYSIMHHLELISMFLSGESS